MEAKREPRIDLYEFFKNVIHKWKLIIVIMVLSSLAVGGLHYYKSIRSIAKNTTSETQINEVAAGVQTEEEILETLSDSEKVAVINYVQQTEWLNAEEEYITNSVLMRTNPANQRQIVWHYLINARSNGELDIEKNVITNYVKSTDFCEGIRDCIDKNAKIEYIDELVNVKLSVVDQSVVTDDDRVGDLSLIIIVPDNVDKEELVNTVNSLLSKHIKGREIVSIKLDDVRESRFVNQSAIATKQNATNTIRDTYNSLNNIRTSLSDKQNKACTAIINSRNNTSTVENQGVTDENKVETRPRISKKYLMAGGLLGFIIYVMLTLLITIAKGSVYSFANAEELLPGIKPLGQVDTISAGRTHELKDNDSLIKNIEKTADSIKIMCKYYNVNKITMLDMLASSEAEVKKELIKAVDDSNISLEYLSAYDDDNSLNIRGILNGENTIIIVCANDKQKNVKRVVEICRDYEKEVRGFIYINN